ncbi:MAG: magnesium and cobalt transport protein CorA [Acidimicrobiales bacterium]
MIIDCAVYRDGKREGAQLALEDAFEAGRDDDAFVWIGLHEPTEDEFAAVRVEFDLHELAVEDAIHAHQRPKVEIYDDLVLVVLKTARYVDSAESVEFAELLVLIGPGYVITVRHGEASALAEVRHGLEQHPELLRCGPAAVLHAVCDRVVDDYSPVTDGLDLDIQQVEADVFSDQRSNPAERIYKLKRQVLDFYRNTEPLVTALEPMVRCSVPHTHPDLAEYFRDVEDHLSRVVAHLETFRDLLTDALNANLAQISVRQNEDMRTISSWAAIIAVPTMLAGVWGMNFVHMPELEWVIGYPLALATLVGAASLVFRRLRRAGWL